MGTSGWATRCGIRTVALSVGAGLVVGGFGAPPVGAMTVGHPPSSLRTSPATTTSTAPPSSTWVREWTLTINGPRGGVPESNCTIDETNGVHFTTTAQSTSQRIHIEAREKSPARCGAARRRPRAGLRIGKDVAELR